MDHCINKVCFNKSYHIKVSLYRINYCKLEPCCVITLTKIFVLHAFLVGTLLRVTTGWDILAGSVATPQCASTGPHLCWLLVPVDVGDCSDVWNVGRCQRAYFQNYLCFLHSFWIRVSLVVWTLPFLPNHRVLVPARGSFHKALDLSFNVVASGKWPFFTDFFTVASSSSWNVVA